ncbi:MAG: hypothetical protein HC780_20025 [Leptolyngbyaceae cyanobacterium CSU_1_3]|nr:hypothetical protein [Leptolyngbyaceae cyanobacterium CSU_1_3]
MPYKNFAPLDLLDISVFILKVLLLSIGISLVIKYAEPLAAISPTLTHVLIAILSPSLAMALVLMVRSRGNQG